MQERPRPEVRDSRGRIVINRHRVPVRLTHWLNVLAMTMLLLSGLQIFNAHPQLYWGKKGSEFDRPILAIHAETGPDKQAHGFTQLGALKVDTTGVLGVSKLHGETMQRAWPGWLTLPSGQDLATGRRWHFFFAWIFALNGLAYLVWSLVSRHLFRDLWPTGKELRGISRAVADHVRLKHATGDAARKYNVLQKLSYLAAIVLISGMVLTGLTMSPGFNAVAPSLLELFGGRQSARTLHFTFASLLVLFVLVHVAEVFLEGPINEVRSMITGRYALRSGAVAEEPRS